MGPRAPVTPRCLHVPASAHPRPRSHLSTPVFWHAGVDAGYRGRNGAAGAAPAINGRPPTYYGAGFTCLDPSNTASRRSTADREEAGADGRVDRPLALFRGSRDPRRPSRRILHYRIIAPPATSASALAQDTRPGPRCQAFPGGAPGLQLSRFVLDERATPRKPRSPPSRFFPLPPPPAPPVLPLFASPPFHSFPALRGRLEGGPRPRRAKSRARVPTTPVLYGRVSVPFETRRNNQPSEVRPTHKPGGLRPVAEERFSALNLH